MDKDQVAEILSETGILLDLKGENPFKTRAYANAARTLEGLNEPLDKIIAENRLGEIKGIGEALQKKITELVTTGKLAYYDELKASIPPGLLELMQIPGVGPRKVQALHEKLGIKSVAELEAACKAGKVAGLAGFGDKTQVKILEGIEHRRTYASRHLLSTALGVSEPVLESLRQHPDVIRCGTAGSLRRWKEVIGDIDFLASSKNPKEVIEAFSTDPGVLSVSAKGETKASVILKGGIQSDLRVVSDAEFPYALLYFTGSKEHNIVLRQRAIQRGLRLNEYGLFRSAEETRDPKLLVKCNTEEEIYQKLGLAYVPPELREDHGEFTVAEKHPLPRLMEWTELRGSLHNHTNWSDGHETLEQVARHMQELGCDYWAITDHSKASFQAHGLDAGARRLQIKEIKKLNQRFAGEGVDFQAACRFGGGHPEGSAGFRQQPARGTRRCGGEPARGFFSERSRQHQTHHSRGGESARPHARTPYRTPASGARTIQGQPARRDRCVRGNGDVDRIEREPAALRSGLAFVALREVQGCEMRHQLRCASGGARGFSEIGRRHRPQRLAGEKGHYQRPAARQADGGIATQAQTKVKK